MPTVELAVEFWNRLFAAGIYVNLAILPGTPNSTSLLRCSVSAAQTPEQIACICETFAQVAKERDMIEVLAVPRSREPPLRYQRTARTGESGQTAGRERG